jgi:predicted TIM-barrel fold metal-dependent hydrolase
MLRIDGHVHIWSQDRERFTPRFLDGLPFPDVDGDVTRLLEAMDANGVARAIVVQTPFFAHDDRYIMEMSAAHPLRLTPIGCLPLRLESMDAERETQRLGSGSLRGCRVQFIGRAGARFALNGGLAPFFRQASDLGLPILVWYRNVDMHAFVDSIAAEYPAIPLVIEHMAYATPQFGRGSEYVDGLLRLSRHRSVHVKLAVHHLLSSRPFPWADLVSLQKKLDQVFGASRLLWGSNFPMFVPDPTYEQRLSVLQDHFPFRSDEDREWVLGRTAEKLWPTR